MCFHKWKYYKDIEHDRYYRICTKCGIACEGYYDFPYGFTGYRTPDKTLCKTNTWVDKETFRLRYELEGNN